MLRKLIAFILLILAVPMLSAQEATATPSQNLGNAPLVILDALNALNTQLGGIGLVLTDLNSYSWAEEVFNDTSLGCPQEGQSYSEAVTRGYVFVFVYRDTAYDYRTSQDGTTVFLCDTYPIQQPATRTPLDTLGAINPTTAGQVREVKRLSPAAGTTLAVSNREVIAASAETGGVNVYSTDSLSLPPDFYEIDELTALALASNDDQIFLATASTDGEISFFPVSPAGFDVTQMAVTEDTETVNTLAISPDLLIVAAGEADGVSLYLTRTGGLLFSIESDTPITALAFGAGLLAAGDSEGMIRLYAVTISDEMSVEYEALDVLTGHTDTIHDLAFNEASTLLASGSRDESARLWNVNREQGTLGAEVANLSSGAGDAVFSVALNADVLATAEGTVVRLWSVADRTILATLTGHDTTVSSVDFADRLLMSAGGTIILWGVGQ